MDLRDGCPFWSTLEHDTPTYPRLEHDTHCDIVVIGAGISGSLVAYKLGQRGANVVVLDRRAPSTGSTVASTGLLQYEIDTPLVELSEMIGQTNARRAYRASFDALDQFASLVESLDSDCQLIPRSSLFLAAEDSDVPILLAEQQARQEIGLEVEFLDAASLKQSFGLTRPAALFCPSAAEVNPYRLALRLIECAVQRHGVRVFIGTRVTHYHPDSTGVTVRTADGLNVRCRKVVFATGYETPEFLDRQICTLKSTYAFTSQVLTAEQKHTWRDTCLIWESADPYFYARTTADGRAMVGGEDDDVLDPDERAARLPDKVATLVRKFNRLFPHIPLHPQFTWAGTFAETKDGLPYIGTTPQFPHGYFALGYGGNGITYSLIAANVICDLYFERPNPLADLFRFDRKIGGGK